MYEHFGAVEADFQSHYGMDLREVLWGDRAPGVRRVLALVNGLPTTGAVFREVAFDGKSWSMTDELLATLIEITDFGNKLLFQTNVKAGTKGWDPIVISRPRAPAAAATEHREMATTEEMSAFFGGDVHYEEMSVSG